MQASRFRVNFVVSLEDAVHAGSSELLVYWVPPAPPGHLQILIDIRSVERGPGQ